MSLSIVSNLSSLLAARSRTIDGSSADSPAATNDVGLAVAVSQASVASSAFASAGPILSQNLLSALQSDPTDPSTSSPSTQLSANRAYGNGSSNGANANAASTTTSSASVFDADDQSGPRFDVVR